MEILFHSRTIKNPISKLNEYCQKGLQQPAYESEQVGKQAFICTVTFQGENYVGPRKSVAKDAKQAVAQIVIDSLNITVH